MSGNVLPARYARVLTAALVASVFLLSPALAPRISARQWTVAENNEWCAESGRYYCEVREISLSPDRGELAIRSTNGSISIESWDRDEIHILARITVKGTGDRARETAEQVTINTRGTIKARGPHRGWWIFGGSKNWSVSYRVQVPARFDLDAHSTNGKLAISGVSGVIEAGTTNGGVTVTGVGGDVECGTTNGGVKAVLEGAVWEGEGLYLHATNGGISVVMPRDYSAELDAATTNGGIRVEHSIRIEKNSRGRLLGTVGDGGPVIRVRTTNGGVRFIETR